MQPTALETPRFRLRRWRTADRAPFAAMNADAEVMQFFPRRLSGTESDALIDRIEGTFDRDGFGLWAVEDRSSTDFLGFVGLNPIPPDVPPAPGVEIGWRLRRESWERGVATETGRVVLRDAFERCRLAEVVSFTSATNRRSQGVMRALGLLRRASRDFDHPRVEKTDLRVHVLHALGATTWRCQQIPGLRPARRADRPFLADLRRAAYHDLMVASFGHFDERTYARHDAAQWNLGGLCIVTDGAHDIGVLQVGETSGSLEIHEIQLLPEAQNAGRGTALVRAIAAIAHTRGQDVTLSTPLRNDRALRLYERLGFQRVASDTTHHHLRWPC
ncbi:MAG: GNAT family N-acetyltransferase [bacterium]|nr:GNAT family N-acetyltransferase [bacterium]